MLTSILQVQVAVKKLKPHVLSNAVDLREFLSEANTLRRLKHRLANLCCKHMHAVHSCYISDIHLSLTFARGYRQAPCCTCPMHQ